MEYFKASEVEYCAGQLRKYREDPTDPGKPLTQKEKDFKNQVKTEFVDLICNARYLIGNSVTLLLGDWERFKIEEPVLAAKLPSPYCLTYQMMLMECGLSVDQHNSISPPRNQIEMRPVLDSHEEFEPLFMEAFPDWVRKNPRSSRYMLPPSYEDDKVYRCLQAADCLAYEARRFVAAYVNDSDNMKIRVAMGRMQEKCDRMYLLNYKSLYALASAQPISDVIPIAPKIDNKTNRPTRQRKH